MPAAAGFLVEFSWRYSFLLFGFVPVVIGIVYVYLPETLPAEDRASGASLGATLRSYATSIRSELRDFDLVILFTGALIVYFVKFGILTFVPLFAIREFGASGFLAGLLISVYGGVRIVVSPLTGRLASITGQKNSMVLTIGLTAVGTGLIAVSPTVGLIGVSIVIYSVGDSFFTPLLNDVTTKKASPQQRGGLVSGLNMMKQ